MICPNCQVENLADSQFCRKCGSQILHPENKINVTKTIISHSIPIDSGKVISGKFKIIRQIGAGGMGHVYEAEDINLKRRVALKFLSPHLTLDQEAKVRFIQEAQAASQLDHPNICTVHEIGEDEDKRIYISMAYYPGESLREKIETGVLDRKDALQLAIQVGKGLSASHNSGIVHRDIKPANILLTKEGTAKIVDFGLAKLSSGIRMTSTGVIMGTMAYMSPEQVRGDDVDQRTDIWSFGVLLFEMLCGELPFKGEKEHTLMYSILEEAPQPLSRYNDDISAPLKQIIQKALEKNPSHRYERIDEIVEDLELIRQGLEPDIKIRRPSRSISRRKFVLAVGIFATIVLILIGTFHFLLSSNSIVRIAVLPLTNLANDNSQNHLIYGIHGQLITEFNLLENVQAISQTTMAQFKESNRSIPEIARQLDVDLVFEGAVGTTSDQILIEARLIDPQDDAPIWVKTIEKNADEVAYLHKDIVYEISQGIKLVLSEQEEAQLTMRREVDPKAYDLLLKGIDEFHKMNSEEATRLASDAIEIDPTLAWAYTLIAWIEINKFYFNPVTAHETFPKAIWNATRAISLDPTIGEAHAALATANVIYHWDWAASEFEFQRAAELDPGILSTYSFFLSWIGEHRGAIRAAEQAIQYSPLDGSASQQLAMAYYLARRPDMAISQIRASIEKFGEIGFFYDRLSRALSYKGMHEDAIDAINKGIELGLNDAIRKGTLGYYYAKSGQIDEAKIILDTLLRSAKLDFVPPTAIAVVYTGLGEYDKAIDWVEKGIDVRDGDLVLLHEDPIWDPLRSDIRFKEIIERIGFPQREQDNN
jgi:serine/threonine-protein kinase